MLADFFGHIEAGVSVELEASSVDFVAFLGEQMFHHERVR